VYSCLQGGGETGVAGNGQSETALPAQSGDTAREARPARNAVMPKHHAGQAGGEFSDGRQRVGLAPRIGEEPQDRMRQTFARLDRARPGHQPFIHAR
jgi:hypothetical protein